MVEWAEMSFVGDGVGCWRGWYMMLVLFCTLVEGMRQVGELDVRRISDTDGKSIPVASHLSFGI